MSDEAKAPLARDQPRRAIPRWLPPAQAPEVASSSRGGQSERIAKFAESRIRTAARRYEVSRDADHAVSALLAARAFGVDDHELPPHLLNAASAVAGQLEQIGTAKAAPPDGSASLGSRQTSALAIRGLRRQLRTAPNNPIALAEVARHHIVLGNDEKAITAMERARACASQNVYLARAQNRLFHHLGDRKAARDSIVRTENWRANPWLTAAEIATCTSMGKPSDQLKRSASLIGVNQWSPISLSELEAAIATEEMAAGRRKKAEVLLQSALRDPTGNALAQACFVTRDNPQFDSQSQSWTERRDSEAEVLYSRARMNWETVSSAAGIWSEAEPYSSRPCHLGWGAANMAGDHLRALEFARLGDERTDDFAHWKNLAALSLAYSGDLRESIRSLEGAVVHGVKGKHFLLATVGLVAYRLGAAGFGDQCYFAATMAYKEDGDPVSVASALLYWGHEWLSHSNGRKAPEIAAIVEKVRPPLIRHCPELLAMRQMLESGTIQNPTITAAFSEVELLLRLRGLADKFEIFHRFADGEKTQARQGLRSQSITID